MEETTSLEKIVPNVSVFSTPTKCFQEVVQAYTEYRIIAEEEKTKRRHIKAWEKTTLAEIAAKRDFVISYLDRSFDERAQNFQLLFDQVDQAISRGDNQQLGLLLTTITEIAKTSPFQELSNLATVKAALDDPDHVWEF